MAGRFMPEKPRMRTRSRTLADFVMKRATRECHVDESVEREMFPEMRVGPTGRMRLRRLTASPVAHRRREHGILR